MKKLFLLMTVVLLLGMFTSSGCDTYKTVSIEGSSISLPNSYHVENYPGEIRANSRTGAFIIILGQEGSVKSLEDCGDVTDAVISGMSASGYVTVLCNRKKGSKHILEFSCQGYDGSEIHMLSICRCNKHGNCFILHFMSRMINFSDYQTTVYKKVYRSWKVKK